MGFRVETDPTGVQDTGKQHLLWAHLIEVKVVFCQRFVRHLTFTPLITQLPAFHLLCVFMGSLQLPSVIHLIQQTDMGNHAIITSYPLQVRALLQNEVDMCAPFCIGVGSGAILNDCQGWAHGNDVPDGYKSSLIGWVFPGAGQLTWFHVFLLHSRAGGSERPVLPSCPFDFKCDIYVPNQICSQSRSLLNACSYHPLTLAYLFPDTLTCLSICSFQMVAMLCWMVVML
jgi:hypothetical protein